MEIGVAYIYWGLAAVSGKLGFLIVCGTDDSEAGGGLVVGDGRGSSYAKRDK